MDCNRLAANLLRLPPISQVSAEGSPTRPIDVTFCPISSKKPIYSFIPSDYTQVTQAIAKKTPLQMLLKLIHFKFNDDGLTQTLIHRIYQSTQHQIEYYVPELVYITVRKMSRPMRKVMVAKTGNSENLRRLILWNIKAFTVIMITKDQNLKIFIEEFQEEVIRTVYDRQKFISSQKAISMLTTTSLVLKKLPKEEIKNKLKQFIKRYNMDILNNTEHTIMIPFRRGESQKNQNSNYVVRIVEQNCSCFPTRKRVPYRIILQTIDTTQLKLHHQLAKSSKSPSSTNPPQTSSPQVHAFFDQIKQQVEKSYKTKNDMKINNTRQYPFVIDQDYISNMTALNSYAKKILEKEKIYDQESNKPFTSIIRDTLSNYKSRFTTSKKDDQVPITKFQIKDNQQLRKYDATYIPTLPSTMRKSDSYYLKNSYTTPDKNSYHKRFTDLDSENQQNSIKVIEQPPKYDGNTRESVWKQPWSQTIKTLKQQSPFRKLRSLKFRNVVIKGGDDLRQEIICMQLIYKMQEIIQHQKLSIFIKPYQIIVLSQNSGMLQFVSNSISIDQMKRQKQLNLYQFYHETFNTQNKFETAKNNFICSLAGSSILTWILKLKDRHNGNILIDIDGHIIHIDFGFILGMSPGGLNFESSPFKLTQEYVQLMGGKSSEDYNLFVELFCSGMKAIRKRCDQLCLILQIMMDESDLQCFQHFRIQQFRERFHESLSDQKYKQYCQSLVQKSCMNSRTAHYDTFQKMTNGIMP